MVDLHSYDSGPDQVIGPAQLYAALLRALGMRGDDVPVTEPEQATAYHQLLGHLARRGRPMLLVLDNVSDPEQVADLLPRGVGGHRVLITSRESLAALPDVRLVDLPVLSPASAVELLATLLQRRRPGDRRVEVEPEAAARLVELCGGLPLAVQIAAAQLADEPNRPLAELADELAAQEHRLQGLDYGGRLAVRAAFDLSHRRLTSEHAGLFAVLAAVPGADTSLQVAAAAADRPATQVRMGLMALCRAHLLEQHRLEGGGPRWRMHDLIRLYAAEQLAANARSAAFERVLAHYQRTADVARQRFTALPGQHVPVGFDTAQQAFRWVLAERPGLLATVFQAPAVGHAEDAVRLATDLGPFLDRARLLTEWVDVASVAAQTSQTLTNPQLAAMAWDHLGLALQYVRRFDKAIAAHEQAREIYRDTDDRLGEGSAWTGLGLVLREVRRFEEAIAAHEQARELFQSTGDRHREGTAWGNLGGVLGEVRRFDEAIAAHEQALEIYRDTGDRHREGMVSGKLGNVLHEVRRFEKAIAAHGHARELFQTAGDRHREGAAWNNLGNALREVQRFEEAIAAHEQAREIFRETGDRHGEAGAWNNLGLALHEVCRFEEAFAAYERAPPPPSAPARPTRPRRGPRPPAAPAATTPGAQRRPRPATSDWSRPSATATTSPVQPGRRAHPGRPPGRAARRRSAAHNPRCSTASAAYATAPPRTPAARQVPAAAKGGGGKSAPTPYPRTTPPDTTDTQPRPGHRSPAARS